MFGPNFKRVYVPWWRPVRLYAWRDDKSAFDPVGWVWRTEANLVRNVNYGWIAFVDDQRPEQMKRCWYCQQPMTVAPKGADE